MAVRNQASTPPFWPQKGTHDPNQTNHTTVFFSQWLGQKWVCDLGWANQSSSLNFLFGTFGVKELEGMKLSEYGPTTWTKAFSIVKKWRTMGEKQWRAGSPFLNKLVCFGITVLARQTSDKCDCYLNWPKGSFPRGSKDCVRGERQYPGFSTELQ